MYRVGDKVKILVGNSAPLPIGSEQVITEVSLDGSGIRIGRWSYTSSCLSPVDISKAYINPTYKGE